MIQFLDNIVERPPVQAVHENTLFLNQVDPFPDATPMLAGVFVINASDALGLRRPPEVIEHITVDPIDTLPTTLFDIEKWVRMLLHQSRLAFEIATSGLQISTESAPHRMPFDPRPWCAKAITKNILDDYKAIARHTCDSDASDVTSFRIVLTGLLLAEKGEASVDYTTLLARFDLTDNDRTDKLHVEKLCQQLIDSDTKLPDKPTDYDGLSDLIVEMRKRFD